MAVIERKEGPVKFERLNAKTKMKFPRPDLTQLLDFLPGMGESARGLTQRPRSYGTRAGSAPLPSALLSLISLLPSESNYHGDVLNIERLVELVVQNTPAAMPPPEQFAVPLPAAPSRVKIEGESVSGVKRKDPSDTTTNNGPSDDIRP